MTTKAQPNELKLTRVYDAPVRAVWDAWTDPAQAAQWWGPRGYSITTHSKDLRPGGHWAYTMFGPNGETYETKTTYLEVEECAKLVYDHGGHDDRPPIFRVTVLFHETDGKTTMDMTMTLSTAEKAEATRQRIKQTGGTSTWDRLAEYLEKETSGKEKFIIARAFAVPQDVMFSLWTDPAHLTQWLPPKGFTMQILKGDIRKGDGLFYQMTNGEVTMYGGTEYLEIQAPGRLVYTQRFCNEQGETTRHPMAPLWPETMLTTVDFVPEDEETTRVIVMWEPSGATAEEIAAFVQMRGGMTLGWTGSFDKLEEWIESKK